jgi:hypothetical protein
MSAARRRAKNNKVSKKELYDELEPIDGDELEPIEGDDLEEIPELEPIDDDGLEEIPELEPMDEDGLEEIPELDFADDELEAIDDEPGDPKGTVIRVEAPDSEADREKYDVRVVAEVPAMEKPEVPDAVTAALRLALPDFADDLRLRRIVVHFAGEAMIPSKIKEPLAGAFAHLRPALVAMQRGYDDELVVENEIPSAEVRVEKLGDNEHRVIVESGDLLPAELRVLVSEPIAALGGDANGQRYEVCFVGKHAPDDQLRGLLHSTLENAGARALTLIKTEGAAPHMLFDRDLEELIELRESELDGVDTELTLGTPNNHEQLHAAIDHMLTPQSALITGRVVRFSTEADDATVAELLERLRQLKPTRVERTREGAEPQILIPRLLKAVTKDDNTTVGVKHDERSRPALLESFGREIYEIREHIRGQKVVVQWPAETQFDEELENACLNGALLPLEPKSVVFRAGDLRMQMFPVAVEVHAHEEHDVVVKLNTEAGLPADLAVAIEKRLESHQHEIQGRPVRFELEGSGPVSRSMQRKIFEQLDKSNAPHAALVGPLGTDILLPRLLQAETLGDKELKLRADAGGRDAGQIEAALGRELKDIEIPSEGSVQLAGPDEVLEPLRKHALEAGASRLLLGEDAPVQVHPALFAEPVTDGGRVTLRAQPGEDAEMLLRQQSREVPALLAQLGGTGDKEIHVEWPGASKPFEGALGATIDALKNTGPAALRVDPGSGARVMQVLPEVIRRDVTIIGRRDAGDPPMRMVGIEWTDEPEEIELTVQQLDAMRDDLHGARVLVLFVDHSGAETPPHKDDEALVAAVHDKLSEIAGAMLLHRQQGEQSMFEAVTSNLDVIQVGAFFRDPRRPKNG